MGYFADICLLYPSSVSTAVSHLCPDTTTVCLQKKYTVALVLQRVSQCNTATVLDVLVNSSQVYIGKKCQNTLSSLLKLCGTMYCNVLQRVRVVSK